jgi:hypothetical protein
MPEEGVVTRQFSCLAKGYKAWVRSREEIERFVFGLGVGKVPAFLVRRNAEANEVHVVFLAPPYGGAVVGKKGVEVVRGVQGHWVRGEDGRLITHVSRQKIPLFLCSPFLRNRWSEGEDADAFFAMLFWLKKETPPFSVVKGTEVKPFTFRGEIRSYYCFWADPSGVYFSGIKENETFCEENSNRCRGCITAHDVWATAGGELASLPWAFTAPFGNCGGLVVTAALDGRAGGDTLWLRLVEPKILSRGEPKVVKEVEVRHALLRRPVEVVDLDPSCGCLLLAKPSAEDGAARWYVLEIGTGRYQRVHHGPGYGLFLGEDLEF